VTQSSTSTKLSFGELESLYDEMAAALDAVPPDRESVFLAKLVLSMAHEFGHAERISELIKQCLHEPSVSDATPKGQLWGAPNV